MRVNFRTYLLGTAMAAVSGGTALAGDGGLGGVTGFGLGPIIIEEDDAQSTIERCVALGGNQFSIAEKLRAGTFLRAALNYDDDDRNKDDQNKDDQNDGAALDDGEIVFEVGDANDNGLKFSFRVPLVDSDDADDQPEESFVYISKTFGPIFLGQDDGASGGGLTDIDRFVPGHAEARDNNSLNRVRLNFDTSFRGEASLRVRPGGGLPVFLRSPGDGFNFDLSELEFPFPLARSLVVIPDGVIAGLTQPQFFAATDGQWEVETDSKVRYDSPSFSGFSLAPEWNAPSESEQPVQYDAALRYAGAFGSTDFVLGGQYSPNGGEQANGQDAAQDRNARIPPEWVNLIPEKYLLPQEPPNGDGAQNGDGAHSQPGPGDFTIPGLPGPIFLTPPVPPNGGPPGETDEAVIGSITTTFNY